ncbi:MAG TPA: hypothetical protein VG276_29035 [Actinomycetes bacterium]|nr:hypothetical protein [Actinomycetes bacterium]
MLRSADELLGPALAETLGHLTLADEDAALVKLAERYAAAIDRAAELAAEADAIGEGLDPDDLPGRQRLALLAAKVEGQAVLGNLGPKLLQALAALQATPAARARRRGGGGGDAGPNRLQALREARRT